ncbi:hypothetical protein LDJ91_08995 [Fusobacterium nucleatum]|uniref:hypothetical protein n=1 Tax=Fusobacterium animalis TaxID=76859 RepID=UPI001C6F1FF3|nr:hypothetical protein [Fusobacterium animalis]QYR68947.1 hypothetical protein JY401_07835 [Fusobacterium animalis]
MKFLRSKIIVKKGEDEVFYFGAIIDFEDYKKFCEIFRKVTNRDRANIYFLEEENESYNI